jgi:hypothetical protein
MPARRSWLVEYLAEAVVELHTTAHKEVVPLAVELGDGDPLCGM